MHRSPPNPSDKSRLIYTFHMIEGKGAVYDEKNWFVLPIRVLRGCVVMKRPGQAASKCELIMKVTANNRNAFPGATLGLSLCIDV